MDPQFLRDQVQFIEGFHQGALQILKVIADKLGSETKVVEAEKPKVSE